MGKLKKKNLQLRLFKQIKIIHDLVCISNLKKEFFTVVWMTMHAYKILYIH